MVMKWRVGAPATVSSLATIIHQLEFALNILYKKFLDRVIMYCMSKCDLNVVYIQH